MKAVVIGVGRRGGDCVSQLAFPPSDDVTVLYADTDVDDLGRRPPGLQLHLGSKVPTERFVRNDPSFSFDAAMADRDVIEAQMTGADAVVIVAGLGGGTGAGGSRALATIARELGLPVIALVTRPFSFEGEDRVVRGRRGYRALSAAVDLIVPFYQDQILSFAQRGTRVRDLITVVNEVVRHSVEALYDILSRAAQPGGRVELGLLTGEAIFSYGVSETRDGVVESAKFAFHGPFFEGLPLSRTRAMVMVVRSKDLTREDEVERASRSLLRRTSEDASFLVARRTFPSLENEVQLKVFLVGDFGEPITGAGDIFVPGPTG